MSSRRKGKGLTGWPIGMQTLRRNAVSEQFSRKLRTPRAIGAGRPVLLGPGTLIDNPRLHHKLHILQHLDIAEWIAIDRDDVRPLACFE